jgi:hypothetical protein
MTGNSPQSARKGLIVMLSAAKHPFWAGFSGMDKKGGFEIRPYGTYEPFQTSRLYFKNVIIRNMDSRFYGNDNI